MHIAENTLTRAIADIRKMIGSDYGKNYVPGSPRKYQNKSKIDQPPVFIIGHWRSGTTMLHELMIQDPAPFVPQHLPMF